MRLCLLLLLAARAHAATTIQFWHSMTGEKGNLLARIVERYNAENAPGRRVQAQFVGSYEEGLNKLRTALIVKKGPHVAQVTDIGAQALIDSHRAIPLDELAAKDPERPFAKLLPQLRKYYEFHGVLQALPFASSNPILYYDADALAKAGIAKPPASYAELTAVAAKLTDPKTRVTGIAWPLHSWFLEQFLAVAGVPFAEPANGRTTRAAALNCARPEAIAFLNLWIDLVKKGYSANLGRGWDPPEQNFLGGRTRMLVTSTSEVFEILRRAPFKVGTAALPSPDGLKRGGTIIGGNALWIIKNKPAEEETAAYHFVKYMASAPVQKEWHTNTGYFPIRTDVVEALEREGFYDKFPAARTAILQLRASPPDLPAAQGALIGAFSEVRETVDSALEEALTGGSDAQTALAKAKKAADAALARYNRIHPEG